MTVKELLEKWKLSIRTHRVIGLTDIRVTRDRQKIKVRVSHGGNMGNTLKDVNENLGRLTKEQDTLQVLRDLPHLSLEEHGSPDYWYEFVIVFKEE